MQTYVVRHTLHCRLRYGLRLKGRAGDRQGRSLAVDSIDGQRSDEEQEAEA